MSASIEFHCPHNGCGKLVRTHVRYAGMQGPCPHCGRPVSVEAPAGEQIVLEPPAALTRPNAGTSALVAGAVALGATALLYVLFFALDSHYLGQLFTQRGPIPFVATFVTCWGMAILALKYKDVREQLQYADLELDFIPLDKGMRITSENVNGFIQHLDAIPNERARDSILGRRIRGALEHFRARSHVPEVQAYLSSHADIDASTVDSGYTLVRAFIWVIPILGFIGTVLGISGAVSGLAGSLDSQAPAAVVEAEGHSNGASAAEEPAAEGQPGATGAQMIAAMSVVTSGLATAFDTTFLALVMAILLLFPTESLKRAEYGMLDRIEAFTNEVLLRRMCDDGLGGPLSPDVAKLIEPAFRRHQSWLMEWQSKVAALGQMIGGDFERHFVQVKQQLMELTDKQAAAANGKLESVERSVADLQTCLDRFRDVSDHAAETLNSSLVQSQNLHEQLARSTQQSAELCQALADSHVGDAGLGNAAEQLGQAARLLAGLANGSQEPQADVDTPNGRRLLGFLPTRQN